MCLLEVNGLGLYTALIDLSHIAHIETYRKKKEERERKEKA